MALDGKTIIKEEITDKDAYDGSAATSINRRNKGNTNSTSSVSNKDTSLNPHSNGSNSSSTSNPNGNSNVRSCRTPDSPESARAIAPRSPMSPQVHHSSLAPPLTRPNRNSSASPVVNGATTTPPPQPPSSSTQSNQTAAAVAAAHVEQARLLGKIRKFLGSLVQFAQEVHPEVSDRVRALVISIASGGITIDEFRLALQEAINLPLRPYVIPLLKTHISLLQREIAALSRATNQTTLQYVTTNENAVMEFTTHGPAAEYNDIFVQLDASVQPPSITIGANGGAASLVFKRRSSDTLIEHHNGVQDWSDYMAVAYPPPAKRLHPAQHAHLNVPTTDSRITFATQPTLFDYSAATGSMAQSESGFGSLMDKTNHREREEREMRANSNASDTQRLAARTNVPSNAGIVVTGGSAAGGEEEWKNIHTMLNCISAMVDKTKRAITILQQRGVDPQPTSYGEVTPATLVEIRRQTEEKVAEFKRSAEDAVSQVKRQAVIEIQRAVVAAETRAAEVMAQERLRMEKFFVEMSRYTGAGGTEREMDNKSPSITAAAANQNACWNCGRKATETCSGCNLARYCGAFCQHKDWEHHHQICGTTRSTDLSTKHAVAAAAAAAAASQVIPLTGSMRSASLARSPPTQSQPTTQQSSQLSSSSSGNNSQQTNSLVPNGIGSK